MAEEVIWSEKKHQLVAAAISIGTAYSGCAFSFRHENLENPRRINVIPWTTRQSSMVLAPTCVLLDTNQKFHSFGYDAENTYSDLALLDDHQDWYFFKGFKMTFGEKVSRRDVQIQDEQGRTLPAKLVFGEVIKYMKQTFLDVLAARIYNTEIHWILTVPDTWRDYAKQFMREAAYMAGIDGSQLSLVLESEAAIIDCQTRHTDDMQGSAGAAFVASPGSKYMVINLGGLAADMTVHELLQDGGLRELHQGGGGPWRGTNVHEEFSQLMIKLVGASVWTKFCDENKDKHIDIQRDLEAKARSIKPDSCDKVRILRTIEMKESYKYEMGETLTDAIKQSPFNGKVYWSHGHMTIDADVFKGLFKKCSDNIVNHIKHLLKQPHMRGTSNFLMVGECSEYPMIQAAVINAFPNGNVIIPPDAASAVLRGAVIFGHRPVTITYKRSKYTYGFKTSPPFDPKYHPQERRVTVGTKDLCRGVFKKYSEEGEDVRVGETRSYIHLPVNADQRERIQVFTSPRKDPKYTDDPDVECLGSVHLKLPESDEEVRVEVNMVFGETELIVKAHVLPNHQTFTSYFDCFLS